MVRLVTTRNEHRVETVLGVGHNGGYRRLQLSPNAIAVYCLAVFFADGKAHFALLVVACAVQQYEIFVGNAQCVLVHVIVLVVLFKSVDRLQNCNLLCGKLMTTLVSASCKRSATAGGLHSCAETVHFAALSFLGLIRSFHFSFSFSLAAWARSPRRRLRGVRRYFRYNIFEIALLFTRRLL